MGAAKPFAPDEHTLLLAHFDENVSRADYAQGISFFAGNGARLTDGWHGKALNLHARGLHERFMETCEDYTPEFEGWGFHARGNADPWQGTLEFWFQLGKTASATLLDAYLQRAVKHPERKNAYASLNLALSKQSLRYTLPTVAGGCFLGDVPLTLSPNDWHHFALTWSQGELVIWLDGRPLATHDMTGQHGLAIFGNPVRYTRMSGCLVDELRISNVVRYTKDFEPAWRDGKRPANAFSGNPAVKRYAPKLFPPATVRLSKQTSDGELILYRGIERQPLTPRAGDIVATHERVTEQGALTWRIKLTNTGSKEAWIEALLSIPVPFGKVEEFFDGCEPRRVIHLPRHRDEYCSTLPFVAASGGGRFIGVGLNPRIGVSDIVNE